MSNNPVKQMPTPPQPPLPLWKPAKAFYCICCSHLMGETEGPLLCEQCAPKKQRLFTCFCNLCGAPLPFGHAGFTVAHDYCISRRYQIQ